MTGFRWFHRLPFQYKLFISYLLLILLPLLITGYFSYRASFESLQKHTKANVNATLEQMNGNITFKSDSVRDVSEYMFKDPYLQKLLRTDKSAYEMYLAGKSLSDYFYTVVHLPTLNNTLVLYVPGANQESYSFLPDSDPLAKGRSGNLFSIDRIAADPWYNLLQRLPYGGYQWAQVGTDEEYGNLSLVRVLPDTSHLPVRGSLPQLAILRITIKIDDVLKDMDYSKIGGSGSYFFLMDANGHMLYRNAQAAAKGMDFDHLAHSRNYLKMKSRNTEWNAELVAFVPVSYLQRSARSVGYITLCAILFTLFMFSLISARISKFFSHQIVRIVSTLHSFRDGEFTKRLRIRQGDELAQISSAFNDMAETIERLIHEMYEVNLRKTKAELQALQAQINPHFLYNTLSSISTLAQLGMTDRMHQMVLELSDFYRLTLNNGEWRIPVRQELQQAQAYIELLQVKYRDKLTVLWDIDERALDCETVKIILQPFIENAIEHGFYRDNNLTVRIVVRSDADRVVLRVIDNGVGMAGGKARELLDAPLPAAGYGIRNVDERIKLEFGRTYGVRIASSRGAGTGVEIAIPAVTCRQEEAEEPARLGG